jgi:hypothetical protein
MSKRVADLYSRDTRGRWRKDVLRDRRQHVEPDRPRHRPERGAQLPELGKECAPNLTRLIRRSFDMDQRSVLSESPTYRSGRR